MEHRSTLHGLTTVLAHPRRIDPRPAWGRLLALPLLTALSGCQGVQSALDPAADDAGRLALLSWVLFGGGTAIFVLVMALVLVAVYAPPERRRWLGSSRAIVIGGFVFPTVTLTALLIFGLSMMRANNASGEADPLRIEVIGEQYWWRVNYLDDGPDPAFVTANEIHVPVGRRVQILLKSADVIHSFWIPNFAGKVDMIPGHTNSLHFTAEREGVYRGQCTEFCGDQHALMVFDVVASDPAGFAGWRARQAQAAQAPATPFLAKGQELFTRSGCGNCHTVRGTPAEGVLGPDLTHVGSRRSIGAGVFPNNAGTLGGWIANTQHLKGGARMPSYGSFTGEELRAVAEYMESLK
jgi:cytochrome c oxidase subunit 2